VTDDRPTDRLLSPYRPSSATAPAGNFPSATARVRPCAHSGRREPLPAGSVTVPSRRARCSQTVMPQRPTDLLPIIG